MDIVVTLPKQTKWEEYQKELDLVKDGSNVMNFKVINMPLKSQIGNKCWICYKDNVIGYMNIVGFEEKDFECSVTGTKWRGKFVVRSGEFTKVEPIPMKGFQGFRYFDYEKAKGI